MLQRVVGSVWHRVATDAAVVCTWRIAVSTSLISTHGARHERRLPLRWAATGHHGHHGISSNECVQCGCKLFTAGIEALEGQLSDVYRDWLARLQTLRRGVRRRNGRIADFASLEAG